MKLIIAKKDLYNRGLCFVKGKEYKVADRFDTPAKLIDADVTNELGELHRIGNWWRYFKIKK